MYVAGFRHRSFKSEPLLQASCIRKSAGGVWRAVVGFLRTLDKRMTENLDEWARYRRYGHADRSDVERRK